MKAVQFAFESKHTTIAVHTRIGAGACQAGACQELKNGNTSNIFVPNTNSKEPSLNECLHWTIIARSVGEHSEIVLIPGHKIMSSSDALGTSFFFRAIVKTPKHCKVKNIAFYGDNGLNSLCPTSDIETPVNERRQAIGYIITYHD